MTNDPTRPPAGASRHGRQPVVPAWRRTVEVGRRHRWPMAAAVVLAVVGATVAVVLGTHPPDTTAARAVPAGVVAPAPTDAPTSDARRVPATPQALLELLSRLLRPTRLSAPVASSDGRLQVQAYLDDGAGPGMIRLRVGTTGRAAPCGSTPGPDTVCRRLPDGSAVSIVTVPDNCERHIAVSVYRPTGNRVDVDVAACLQFDGTANPPGRLALTAEQAVTIASDTRWGEAMAVDLVTEGERDFPRLRRAPMPEPAAVPAPDPAPSTVEARPALPIDAAAGGALQWEDADGDRADDYCRRIGPARERSGRLACTLSAGDTFGRTVTSAPLDWGSTTGRDWEDVNGDNRSDYCRRTAPEGATTGSVACTLFTGTAFDETITSADLVLGPDIGWAWDDANGDNKADYCRRLDTGRTGRLACTLSTGSGFGSTITSKPLDLGTDIGWEWEDVNGDERSDYCRRLDTGRTGRLACTLSTGSGFGSTITSEPLDLGTDIGWDWEDANGDDRSDYCRRLGTGPTGTVGCTLSTGSGFGTTIVSADLNLGEDAGVAWEDANADERTDYCRVLDDSGGARLACTPSTGTGFGATVESGRVERGRASGSGWADLNGDERKDFCRRVDSRSERRLACTLSTGSGFGATVESAPLQWGFDD